MKEKYSIGILEDHIATMMGYQSQLKANDKLAIVWTANYYSEVESKIDEHVPDLLILDVGVKISNDTKENYPILHVIPSLLEKYPEMVIIVISMHNRPALIRAIKKAGASGYILKDDVETFRKLDQVLVDILQYGGIYFSPNAEKLISQPDAVPSLTKRQNEILSLLASNPAMEYKILAAKLHVSPSTIRNHLSDIYLKLGVNRLSSAIVQARKLGLIAASDVEDLNLN